MVRLFTGCLFQYLIVPGYLLALVLLEASTPPSPPQPLTRAVSTGRMTVTFILSMAVGAATVMEGRSAVIDGFGLIALVALAPILSVILLQIVYRKKEGKTMETVHNHRLIVTIVNKGWSEKIVEASRGSRCGRRYHYLRPGTGIHERQMLFGIPIEPEKELVLTVIPRHLTEKVLAAIVEAGDLNKLRFRIAFCPDVPQVAGIVHSPASRNQVRMRS